MTKNNFLNNMSEYIDSLRDTTISGDDLKAWIKKEAQDFGENFTDKQIEWIAKEVEDKEE